MAVALLLLPWLVALVSARRHHLDAGEVSILVAVSVGLSGLWLMWATYRGPRRADNSVGEPSMAHVADHLAIAVRAQWEAEATMRRLNDPYPLPVSWIAADPSLTDTWDSIVRLATTGAGWSGPQPGNTWATNPDDLAGEGGDLVNVLAKVPTGRLMVLGEPGAGKTMLMVRLVLDLLARRVDGDPVPILASVAPWNPKRQDLRSWLAAQLTIDHPSLADAPPTGIEDPTQATALVVSNLIMPILDGLDEMPDEIRRLAISRINDALRPGGRIVVTCRRQQYQDVVKPDSGVAVSLRAAAAIQLSPLDADDVSAYLCDDASGPVAKAHWAPVLAMLGTDTPVGQALTTPLMVSLARAIYNPRPGELVAPLRAPVELCSTALTDRTAVESLLFDSLIPAAYRRDPVARWKTPDAERWLVFLAQYLQRMNTAALKWWNLGAAAPLSVETLAGRAAIVIGFAATAVLTTIPAVGIDSGFVAKVAVSLAASIVIWVAITLAVPFKDVIPLRGLGWGYQGGWGSWLSTPVRIGLICMTIFIPAIALEIGRIGQPFGGVGWILMCLLVLGIRPKYDLLTAASPRSALDRDRGTAIAVLLSAGLVIGPGLGLICGIVLGLLAGLASGITAGLIAGFAAFPLICFVAMIKVSTNESAAMPEVGALFAGPLLGLPCATAIGVIFGLGKGLVTGSVFGLALGLVVGFYLGVVRSAWLRWSIAHTQLVLAGKLPWRTMCFLEEAHKRGVLRQDGSVYEFRHLGLQRRLARHH
jgi:NACHT domain